MYKSFHLPSFFHPITQERGVSKRQGRCWAAGQGQPTTGSHGTVVTHPTFSGRRGKCISSAQQSRNLKMISSHFPVSVACGTEWLKPWKIRQLTHLYMLFKKNKTVDNCCAVLCTFYCLPKKTRAAQRCRSSLCPTNQPQHLRFFFSSRAVQRIVFLTGNNIFQKTSQLVSEYWRFWHITIELHGYTSWYLYAFSFIRLAGQAPSPVTPDGLTSQQYTVVHEKREAFGQKPWLWLVIGHMRYLPSRSPRTQNAVLS